MAASATRWDIGDNRIEYGGKGPGRLPIEESKIAQRQRKAKPNHSLAFPPELILNVLSHEDKNPQETRIIQP